MIVLLQYLLAGLNVSEYNDSSIDIVDDVIAYDEDTAQVNLTWNMLDGAEMFIIQIEELNRTIHTVGNYYIVNLTYGTYSASMVALNPCGKYHQNFSIMVEATPAPGPDVGMFSSSFIF